MRNRKRTGWHKYINGLSIATVVTVLFIIIPLYWLVATSFKNPNSIGTSPPSLGPTPFSTENYYNAFVGYDFGVYFKTSVIVTLSTTALILPYTAFNLPFAIWILRNYMLGIPKEMEETARIDGARPLRTVWTIILPMALPGVFTAGIFCFTACWTEFLMALTFNSANNYRTIPVGIAEFGGNFQVPYGTIFAASVVAVVPIGILVFIFRRFVISGLTSGAVKG